jgi:orotidine-5'-phosphate decarboxylase
MKSSNYNPIIVALDVKSESDAITLAKSLSGVVGAFKVGLELVNSTGLNIFDRLRDATQGSVDIFYDAKFHDIPNTVAGAIRSACKHRLWMINIHASGGSEMMQAAVKAASEQGDLKPLVIAVTVLTSIDDNILNNELGIPSNSKDQVVRLAKLTKVSGCDGVVASPLEVKAIREACGPEFLIITPGVRPMGAETADQKRIMTPEDAIKAGSDYLVIGRPITAAPDPRKAAEQILAEIR